MTDPIRPGAPAGFVPQVALCFTAGDGSAAAASATQPLPVSSRLTAALSAPLSGSATASMVAGPFTPDPGRTIWLSLSGSWSGTVAVRRSLDGGATRTALTVGGMPWAVFTGNAQEAIGEESVVGATYYLAITLTAGTLGYRMQQ